MKARRCSKEAAGAEGAAGVTDTEGGDEESEDGDSEVGSGSEDGDDGDDDGSESVEGTVLVVVVTDDGDAAGDEAETWT